MQALSVASRRLSPSQIMLGGAWLGPNFMPDSVFPDGGQANADATVLAAVRHGIREIDTAPYFFCHIEEPFIYYKC
jgi:aryl-alcohol dehydrogenase-like predicted oxidoreductase